MTAANFFEMTVRQVLLQLQQTVSDLLNYCFNL